MNKISSISLLFAITSLSGGCFGRHVDWAESLEVKGTFVDERTAQPLDGVRVYLFRNDPRMAAPNLVGESKDGILNARLERKWGNKEIGILPGMYIHRRDRFLILCENAGYTTVKLEFPRPKYVYGAPTCFDLGLVEMTSSTGQ